MRKMVLLAATIALSATAAQGQTVTKTVVSGRALKLNFYSSVNPDCSSRGRPTIRLTRAPEHGRVTITQTMDFPNFPTSNVRVACDKRRVEGTAINYVSERGFVGTDNLQAETIFPDGKSRQRRYTIKVVPVPSAAGEFRPLLRLSVGDGQGRPDSLGLVDARLRAFSKRLNQGGKCCDGHELDS